MLDKYETKASMTEVVHNRKWTECDGEKIRVASHVRCPISIIIKGLYLYVHASSEIIFSVGKRHIFFTDCLYIHT